MLVCPTCSKVKPWVSFTKLCDASYNQITHRRSHKLIWTYELLHCFGGLCCARVALLCVRPQIVSMSCIGTREPNVWTQQTNVFVKDIPGTLQWQGKHSNHLVMLPFNSYLFYIIKVFAVHQNWEKIKSIKVWKWDYSA